MCNGFGLQRYNKSSEPQKFLVFILKFFYASHLFYLIPVNKYSNHHAKERPRAPLYPNLFKTNKGLFTEALIEV